MAFDPNLFTVSINPIPENIVLGKTGTVTVSASNANPADWGYNLGFTLTLPDGVSFVSAAVPPTSQTINLDSTITLTWVSLKDMAPNEIGYTFPITLKSDEIYRALPHLDVAFGTVLSPVALSATVDTKPRGSGEPGNIQYTKNAATSVIPARYAISKTVPGKEPKGAGIPPIPPGEDAQWPFPYSIVVENNTRQTSLVTVNDVMENGLRYIGPITAVGPDAVQFLPPNPVITNPTPGGQDNVTIAWNNVLLSSGALDTIGYDVAIWDNLTVSGVVNVGNRILHQTPLSNAVTMSGVAGPVNASGSTLAMDLTIDKSQSPTALDVGTTINYTLAYRVNQYDALSGVLVTDVISDGQTYQSGSAVPVPTSVSVKNPVTGETTVTWDLGALPRSTAGTITFDTVVDANYTAPPGNPVVAGDSLGNAVAVSGTNVTEDTPTPDSSSSAGEITISSIDKSVLNFFYKDGTPKPSGMNALAPGDFVEFKIDYNAPFNAEQMSVYIDDFLPLNTLASGVSGVTYSPFPPTSGPLPIGNNGLEWFIAPTISGMTNWNVTFDVPVANVNFVGSQNNLAKLELMNTSGMVFSARDQVAVDFGQPDMLLSKAVSGTSPTAVLPGQTYTYSVLIQNPQNPGGTIVDAFSFNYSDIIPNYLSYVSGSLSASGIAGSPNFDPPVFTPTNQIGMNINHMNPDDEISITYQVTVDPGIGPNLSLTNQAQTTSPYSQPFVSGEDNYQYPGLERSDSETLTSADAPLTKTADISSGVIGDTVQYSLSWTVASGLKAYDVVFSDILPSGQAYDNNPSPVPPASVSGLVVTWPSLPVVDATSGAVTLVYSFRSLITSAVSLPPTFIDVQSNTGRVNWNSVSGAEPNQNSGTVNVDVLNPHMVLAKAERNVSRGEVTFGTSTNAIAGEIIEYRLTATNNGSAAAYAIQIVDQSGGLDSGTQYLPGTIIAAGGTTATYDIPNRLINWQIPTLAVATPVQLFFRVRVQNGLTPGSTLTNAGSVNAYSNVNLAFIYPPENSNSVDIHIQAGVRGIALSDLTNEHVLRIRN